MHPESVPWLSGLEEAGMTTSHLGQQATGIIQAVKRFMAGSVIDMTEPILMMRQGGTMLHLQRTPLLLPGGAGEYHVNCCCVCLCQCQSMAS